jgi:putative glutathione S-transferase
VQSTALDPGLIRDSIVEGAFVRTPSAFRDRISSDGSTPYAAEPGRYHLYVSLACPWSHRAVIVRKLKGLEELVGISFVDPIRDDRGWAFTGGSYVDVVNGFDFLAAAYAETERGFHGRISVPVLWDRETERIVNNESADLMAMFNDAFNAVGANGLDLRPASVVAEMDVLSKRLYHALNNGVYKAGFAQSQLAYEAAVRPLFALLDELEQRLATRRFLMGERITEIDWRAFVTLVRFDAVYYGHFKCNVRRVVDYPNLWGYTRDLYQQPGIAATVAIDQIKRHYYMTHVSLNPTRIVPVGPEIDFDAPPARG